jgi:flagellar biosynthesis protein FliQ
MTIEESIAWGQQSLLVILAICAPPLLAALVIGFVVSLLQAVTQIHEMTLAFIPKIIGVFIVLWLMGDWMLQQAVQFGVRSVQSIEQVR